MERRIEEAAAATPGGLVHFQAIPDSLGTLRVYIAPQCGTCSFVGTSGSGVLPFEFTDRTDPAVTQTRGYTHRRIRAPGIYEYRSPGSAYSNEKMDYYFYYYVLFFLVPVYANG